MAIIFALMNNGEWPLYRPTTPRGLGSILAAAKKCGVRAVSLSTVTKSHWNKTSNYCHVGYCDMNIYSSASILILVRQL